MMDYKRMWMHLAEEVEEEAKERAFYQLDTLLANMESWEQFEADGKLAEYALKKSHMDVICDYGIAWGSLKGQLEELQDEQDEVDIVDLLELMETIEYSQFAKLLAGAEEGDEQEVRE